MGRLTRNPNVTYSQGEKSTCIARYTLAVDRKFKRNGEPDADFINCVAFGKLGEFAEKYLKQGTKIVVTGRIQTGSYTNKDGARVNTTDIVVEEQEFAESKASASSNSNSTTHSNGVNGFESTQPTNNTSEIERREFPTQNVSTDGFMNIPDGIEESLPFL